MFQMFRGRGCICAYACVRAYALLKVGSRTGRQLSLAAALSAARTPAGWCLRSRKRRICIPLAATI